VGTAPRFAHAAAVRPRVLQITAAAALPEAVLFARVAAVAALPEAARRAFAVQLRDPELPARALLDLGARLRAATRAAGAGLVVNDRLDLARALGADGAHLGRRSVTVADARALLGDGAWISVACHSVDEVVRAAGEGADAAVLSPIFPSPGKGAPLGVPALAAAREALAARGLRAQIVALGGVTAESAGACFAAGADAVAAIRADLGPVLDAPARSC
jgi:thiamine-phosphate pyrophosphorylase